MLILLANIASAYRPEEMSKMPGTLWISASPG